RVWRISRISRADRRAGGIQRKVHVQPDGIARRLLCDAARTRAADLSQFFSAGGAVAVFRTPYGEEPMNTHTDVTVLDWSSEIEVFRSDVLAGLRRPKKALPCKYLYDQRGSELFDQICGL